MEITEYLIGLENKKVTLPNSIQNKKNYKYKKPCNNIIKC